MPKRKRKPGELSFSSDDSGKEEKEEQSSEDNENQEIETNVETIIFNPFPKLSKDEFNKIREQIVSALKGKYPEWDEKGYDQVIEFKDKPKLDTTLSVHGIVFNWNEKKFLENNYSYDQFLKQYEELVGYAQIHKNKQTFNAKNKLDVNLKIEEHLTITDEKSLKTAQQRIKKLSSKDHVIPNLHGNENLVGFCGLSMNPKQLAKNFETFGLNKKSVPQIDLWACWVGKEKEDESSFVDDTLKELEALGYAHPVVTGPKGKLETSGKRVVTVEVPADSKSGYKTTTGDAAIRIATTPNTKSNLKKLKFGESSKKYTPTHLSYSLGTTVNNLRRQEMKREEMEREEMEQKKINPKKTKTQK